jgi:predicted amidohydrolase YtcJ
MIRSRPTATPTTGVDHDACCGGMLVRHIGALAVQDVPSVEAPRRAHVGTFVVRGATVLPVDDAFGEAEAFAVRDGRVLAVGSEADVMAAAGADATVVDRPGAVILPGFVEPHAHVILSGIQSTFVDVRPQRFDDVASVLDHLRTVVPDDGTWLVASQFDPSLQAGPDVLTADDLDAIAMSTPIVVLNASGHLAYANHAALAAAGITRDTPDIDGSPYGRDTDGTPNGVLQGQPAIMSVLALAPTSDGSTSPARSGTRRSGHRARASRPSATRAPA